MLAAGLYRTSSYMIDVRLEDSSQFLLIHGYTGAMDIVNESLVSFLKKQKAPFSKDRLPCSEETVALLEKRNYITNRSEDEEYKYVERLAIALHKQAKMSYANFTFVVSYGCNFRCPYCFETNKNRNIVFTSEMVDKAFQAIEEIQPEKRLRSNLITLYGGEPLLKENRQIVSYILARGKDLGVRFKAITNGYDLDSYEELLSLDMISNLQITVDGLRDRHNEKRIHQDGSPTFDRILKNIGIALNKGISVVVRVNTDRSNLNDVPLLDNMLKTMYPKYENNLQVHSAVLHDYNLGNKKSDFFSQLEFMKEQERFNYRYGCEDCGLLKNVYKAISEKKPLKFKSIYCGAQANSYVLDPLGKIFACWEVVGKKEFEIGDYSTSVIQWNKDVLSRWRDHNVLTIDSCRHCKYALLCGGGCADKNFLNLNYCTQLPVILKYVIKMAFKKRHIIV